MPLEEIAAIFGDKDEIMVYSQDIKIGDKPNTLVVQDHEKGNVETIEVNDGVKEAA